MQTKTKITKHDTKPNNNTKPRKDIFLLPISSSSAQYHKIPNPNDIVTTSIDPLFVFSPSLSLSRSAVCSNLSLTSSKREPTNAPAAASLSKSTSMPLPPNPLPTPFGQLSPSANLTAADLRLIAYDIFVAACRTSAGKPLAFTPSSPVTDSSSTSSAPGLSHSPSSVSSQRSLTSTAASKMKKAFGLRSSTSGLKNGSAGKDSGAKSKNASTIGELMRVQMRISEAADSKVRRGLLRISAGQLGKRIESVVLPLELLQQFKASDFTDPVEYDEWQKRNLRTLEAGLLLHPRVPISKSDISPQRLRQIIRGALERPIETGRNNESMQVLRSAVMALASRSADGTPDSCHWADGFPLNLHLYEMLLEACFDVSDESSIVEEVDELLEQIKKTWGILGLNEMFHNLCFTWVLFNRYVATGQTENELLYAADRQLTDVVKDAKTTKDPEYHKVLDLTLSSILGWAEKRLLAYHDTFDSCNIQSMQSIVSLGVTSATTLAEGVSNEYRRRRKNEVDVARKSIDTYIRSSLRTSFAQRMEKADSSRRASRNGPNSLPVLAILAKDVSDLAVHEKSMFSPVLKIWHPFAAGVAVATLHVCYGNELMQFVSGITELTPDAVQILRAADKLEKDLVQIAVEDSVDSDDGGKGVIREMPPYEAETVIANLVKIWIKSRVDRMKEWVDRNIQQEVWNPLANKDKYAPSCVEVLRILDNTLDAFFQLPIPTHPALLPDLVAGLDRCLQYYVAKTKAGCGSKSTYIPTLPALTRCSTESKFQGVFKKKDKTGGLPKRNSQVATINGESSLGVPQLCVRINTLHQIKSEIDVLEKRIVTHLRNSESAQVEDFSNGLSKKFDLTTSACVEGVQQLSEALAYKVIFHDLCHVLWDGLYVGDTSSSRIYPFIQELEQLLLTISDTVYEKVRTRIVTDILKASVDGFLLVMLAGGPSRSFTRQDSQILEDDFKSIKDLFWANGDGLPIELIDKFSATASYILPLFKADTETLIDRFRRAALEACGSAAKSRLPLPPASGQWHPSDPNTILRVLCYRNEDAASKFLKKTYNLPKKI